MVTLFIGGIFQIASAITCAYYMKIIASPLTQYMADNLRSNYTGGLGAGYLDRQYDRSIDWVQINVIINFTTFSFIHSNLFSFISFSINVVE
jgi:hypothetical protein